MIEGFLLHLGPALRSVWSDALPRVLLDTWWRRGDAARVFAILELSHTTEIERAMYAALDRDRDRGARQARLAIAANGYPEGAAAMVGALAGYDVFDAARAAIRDPDMRRPILRLIEQESTPEAVPDDAMLKAWHAIRVDPGSARPALAAAWDWPGAAPTATWFATRAIGAWDVVPSMHAGFAARLCGLAGELAAIEHLAAHVEYDHLRAEIYAAAAVGIAELPASWHATLREAEAGADERYTEGLITNAERDQLRWASARCDGEEAIAALERAAIVDARASIEHALRDLEAPPRPPTRRAIERLEKALADACGDPGSKLWRLGREIERVGDGGDVERVRDAIDRIEAVRGPLGDAIDEAQIYYPGRALEMCANALFWTAHRRSVAVVALARDGEVAAAREHAAQLFAEPHVAFDQLRRVATFVLGSAPDARERLAAYTRSLVDRLPSDDWLETPIDAVPPTTAARSPELEASLAESDDPAIASVYADFLQSRGDPRGEVMALQLAGREAEAMLAIEHHRAHLLAPLARYAHTLDGTRMPAFTWRHGFLASARLGFYPGRVAEARDASLAAALDELLSHPSAALLRELVVTVNIPDLSDLSPIVPAIARHGAPALRLLRIGEFGHVGARRPTIDIDYEISWAKVPDLAALWPHVPRLETLVLQGSLEEAVLAGIALPRLRSLVIMTGGMARENTAAIARAAWPALETLELWFGRAEYGGTTTLADVLPLLASPLPNLRVLRLMNAELTDELVAPLAASPLLPQLREVSLALGTLSDAGAAELAAHRDRFAHLAVLDLDRNCLTDDGIALVEDLATSYDDQKDERYASVGE